MILTKDILSRDLKIGDKVLYARKQNYSANGELVECTIIKITDKFIGLTNRYKSTEPHKQLYKL
jgi:hypothetical protein